MGREARTLVGLEHPVTKGVLLCHLKIRLYLRRLHIRERRVWRDLGTVHFALSVCSIEIAHLNKRGMGVAEIVVVSEVDWAQRDGLALGVDAVLDDVGAACDQNWILKQIVGCAVLLEDHDDVLDAWWCATDWVEPRPPQPFRLKRTTAVTSRVPSTMGGGARMMRLVEQEERSLFIQPRLRQHYSPGYED